MVTGQIARYRCHRDSMSLLACSRGRPRSRPKQHLERRPSLLEHPSSALRYPSGANSALAMDCFHDCRTLAESFHCLDLPMKKGNTYSLTAYEGSDLMRFFHCLDLPMTKGISYPLTAYELSALMRFPLNSSGGLA